MFKSARSSREIGRSWPFAGRRAPTRAVARSDISGAAADLAYARLLSDNVEGAAEALAPLWEVPAEQRKTGVVVRTARISRHLARPHYHGSQFPSQLREQVEEFTRVSPPYRLGPPAALLSIGP